eukprot:7736222-Pyramimonas_sp.AAC.1
MALKSRSRASSRKVLAQESFAKEETTGRSPEEEEEEEAGGEREEAPVEKREADAVVALRPRRTQSVIKHGNEGDP